MPGPRPTPIILTDLQRTVLERIIRRATSSVRLVRRTRLILEMAQGANNAEGARRLGHTLKVPPIWRRRWLEAGPALEKAKADGAGALERAITALFADRPRPGAPDTFTPKQVVQIIAIACDDPAASGRPIDHWTTREIQDEAMTRRVVASISESSVRRFLTKRR